MQIWMHVLKLFVTRGIDISQQKAPIEERFMLMNQFKQEISHMNEDARIDAITKLKSITRSEHSEKAIKELKHRVKQTFVRQI